MFLAVDAGGTSTRALALDAGGRALGYGRSSGGNPTSAGVAEAVEAIGRAAQTALTSTPVRLALIAMAGERTAGFTEQVTVRLRTLGVERVVLAPDLLGIFGSGTPQRDGYVLVAGTGSIAARVRDDRVERVVGGKGWLLGDAGSGFWVGHQVVRAVVSALDGQGPDTALTGPMLDALGVQTLDQVVSVLYARRPVQLAALAPLAFAAAPTDAVARSIVDAAATALADLVSVVRVPELAGPVVVGGSVLVRGLLAAPPELRAGLVLGPPGTAVVPVDDGVVGAAVLALRHGGVEVDETLFATLRAELARITALRS